MWTTDVEGEWPSTPVADHVEDNVPGNSENPGTLALVDLGFSKPAQPLVPH